MSQRKILSCSISLVSGLVAILMFADREVIGARTGRQDTQGGKTVEEVRKNIRVLKGLPDSRLLTAMHFMRASLGVRCDYCHVAEEGKYWMDDKPAKQIARQHIQMTFDINKANFGGRTVVTCNTCHQGHVKPVSIPSVEQGVFENTTREDLGSKPVDPLPSAEQVVDRYLQAMGGKEAFSKITSRVTKLSLLRSKLVNAGTPKAAVINRGEVWSVEIYQKAPNKYLAITTSPDGVIYQGFNGATGWIKTSVGQREMNSRELTRIRQQADLYKELRLKDQYSSISIGGKERLGSHEVYVIEAVSKDNRTERLLFDTQSGLLLRKIVLTETLLGIDPEQTDFEDYRDIDGVKLPFTIRTSYLDDNHFGTTRRITEVRQNISVDETLFNIPGERR